MNPNLLSPRPLDYENAEDVDALWAHYHWMAGLKVNWFSICLDDISQGKDARGQAIVVNEILRRLREQNQQAQMVFCPTFYWGTGDETNARKYLETLATTLHPDVYLFWTGTSAVVPTISAETARHYKQRVKHRLIIWDNYPVNDSAPTLHLGPLTGRDPRLCDIADGYMANPLCPQNEINRIPLLTIADYAYNPMNYDPARSIGQSILHLAHTPGQQSVLRDLVELYPGMLLAGQGTAWNPVLFRFGQIVSQLHARHLADLYLHHVENVATRLERDFPDHFQAAGKTLRDNMIIMKELYMDHYVTKPAADKPPARRRPR